MSKIFSGYNLEQVRKENRKEGKNIVSTSILAADFTNIKDTVKELESAETDLLHLDVMDGCFVPNISFGPKMCKDIGAITNLPLDIHLMINEPNKYLGVFAAANPEIITVHIEATKNLQEDLQIIRGFGVKAGVSVSPDTPVSVLEPYLDEIDLILIMSVYPGFGGQSFIEASLEKVREAKELAKGRDIIIEVDGGVADGNAAALVQAGCDILVSGSYITNAKDKRASVLSLKNAK